MRRSNCVSCAPFRLKKSIADRKKMSFPQKIPTLLPFRFSGAQALVMLNGLRRHWAASRMAFDGESASVLLVGRYNRLKPRNLDDINRRYSRLSVFFRTIHSSKGLEADHVIILGAEKGRHGLPSEMADDPLLSIVLSRQEQFEHAEERRVFYVALTRARKSVSIIARKDSPSSFVQEFLGDKKYGVSEYGLAQPRRYLCARCGGQMRLTKGKRYICEHWDNCDAILPACPACGIGLPVRVDANSTMSRCACGAAFHHCEQCADGWLVRRSGKYGPFFGCVNYPRCRGRRSK